MVKRRAHEVLKLKIHLRFVDALNLFGKNWKKVEEQVASRSGAQIRSHAQKYFLK